jgi:hypothetical protein
MGTPRDKYEREADQIANQVMQLPGRQRQHQSSPAGESENTGTVRASRGAPLDPATREFMESRFGHPFDDVRVHTDGQAATSAEALGAKAYTTGRDIVFGAGEYSPGTLASQRLLAHELTHVVQQSPAGEDRGQTKITRAGAPLIQRALSDEDAVRDFRFTVIPFAEVERAQRFVERKLRGVPAADGVQRIRELNDLVFLHELREYLATLRPPTPQQVAKLQTLLNATTTRIRELKGEKELQSRREQRRSRAARRRKKMEQSFSFTERAGETGQIADFVAEVQEQKLNRASSERVRHELDLPIGSRPTERALRLALDVQNLKEPASDRLRLPTSELEAAGNLLLDFAGHTAVDDEHARDQVDAALTFVEGQLAAALIRARSAESEATELEAPTGPFAEVFRPLVEAENTRRASRGTLLEQAPLNYIDFFARATYELTFRAEPGRLSTKIQLSYPDGAELIVDLSEIKNDTLSEDDLRTAIAYGKDARSRRVFPDASLNRSTTPRLFRAAQQAVIVMEDYNVGFILETFPIVFDLLTGAAFPAGPIPTAAPKSAAAPKTAPKGTRTRPGMIEGGGQRTTTPSTPEPQPRKALRPGKEPKGALQEPGRIEGGGQRTTPINAPNPNVGPPAAFAKKASRRADVATKHGIKAENDAALILEKNGYEVQQLKEKTGFPDLTITTRVGGKRTTRIFDVLAPITSNVENVMGRISEKVSKGENRIVLYLRDSSVDVKELKATLLKNPVVTRGLDEILVITNAGEVVHFWP